MNERQFRFQDFEIWKRGAALSGKLFHLADQLEGRKLYRFAEQLRGATLSITNNIAEVVWECIQNGFREFFEHITAVWFRSREYLTDSIEPRLYKAQGCRTCFARTRA